MERKNPSKLTDNKCAIAIAGTTRDGKPRKARRIGDAGCRGLFLNVTDTGGKSWTWMFTAFDRRRAVRRRYEMGLGSYPKMSLADAHEEAKRLAVMVAQGLNPI